MTYGKIFLEWVITRKIDVCGKNKSKFSKPVFTWQLPATPNVMKIQMLIFITIKVDRTVQKLSQIGEKKSSVTWKVQNMKLNKFQ